ncbi:molybdopterin-dependent oxidoreductase [Streptomyces sp. NPDC004393]
MGGERQMVTHGFTGRPRRTEGRVPPGQFVTSDFPVLTAGPTQHVPARAWELVVTDGITEKTYAWASLHDLGVVDLTTDIHCVTHWSKLGTTWQGVPVAAVLEDAGVADEPYALVSSYGGYTTNVPVEDLVDRDAMVAVGYEGGPIPAEHGGPVRLLVPHLYLWKSAKWLRGIRVMPEDELGFWENAGYHHRGDPLLEQRYYGD